MIVFVSDPNLIPCIAQKSGNPFKIFNLTSLYSGYQSLSALVTNMYDVNHSGLPTVVFVDTVDFDIQYANKIFSIPAMFEAFMTIVINTYQGFDVFILVQRDNYRDALMESIIKLIQQRYGYNSWIVNDIDDIECLHEPMFSPYGIMQVDQDLNQYEKMYRFGQVNTKLIDDSINVE